MTLHQSVAQNLFDMRRCTFDIGVAQLPSVTEIAPKSQFLCVKRSLKRYNFRVGARAIRYGVNITQTYCFLPLPWSLERLERLSITLQQSYIFLKKLFVKPYLFHLINWFNFFRCDNKEDTMIQLSSSHSDFPFGIICGRG